MVNLSELLMELSDSFGPSGFEDSIRKTMHSKLIDSVDTIYTDGLGSLISIKECSDNPLRVMISAHMDEVGLMVRYVTDDGFVKFQTLGGWLDQALIGQLWNINTSIGNIVGVTGIKTPHVMSVEDRSKIFNRESIFIDVGAISKEDAEERLGIKPGDPISPATKSTKLNGEDYLMGKAWDDRVGLAVLVKVMESISSEDMPATIYGVATVQEEIGLRGAHTSSYEIKPDIAINIEAGVSGDYPSITEYEAQEKLGKGPAIFLHDSSMLPNLKLRDLVVDTAKSCGINLQYNVLSGYGQDGAEMQKSGKGTPTVNLTVPTRYMHSHNSIIHINDVRECVSLVIALLRTFSFEEIKRIKSFL
jgi:endoglucanase